MPTEEWFKANPKVSGYISQTLYERLKRFASERSSSISQALTVVLAEYFGVDQEVDRASVGGVTLAQLQKQKDELDKLSELLDQKLTLVDQRFLRLENEINSIGENSSLLPNQQKFAETQDDRLSTQVGEISRRDSVLEPVPEIIQDEGNELTNSVSKLPIELLGEPHNSLNQLELSADVTGEQIDSILISKLQIEPVSTKVLALRLGVYPDSLGKKKKQLSEEEFYQWIASKDPDGITWNTIGSYQERSKGYLPAASTPDELLSKLLSWFKTLEESEQNQDLFSDRAQMNLLEPQSQDKLGSEVPEKHKSEPVSDQPLQEGFGMGPLAAENLAARFGVTPESLRNRRAPKQVASFPEWSRSKDPDGFAWQYVKESKMYRPVEESFDDPSGEPNSSLPELNGSFNVSSQDKTTE